MPQQDGQLSYKFFHFFCFLFFTQLNFSEMRSSPQCCIAVRTAKGLQLFIMPCWLTILLLSGRSWMQVWSGVRVCVGVYVYVLACAYKHMSACLSACPSPSSLSLSLSLSLSSSHVPSIRSQPIQCRCVILLQGLTRPLAHAAAFGQQTLLIDLK